MLDAVNGKTGSAACGAHHRLETRPVDIFEFSKMEDRIEERLALMASTARWVSRFGLV